MYAIYCKQHCMHALREHSLRANSPPVCYRQAAGAITQIVTFHTFINSSVVHCLLIYQIS